MQNWIVLRLDGCDGGVGPQRLDNLMGEKDTSRTLKREEGIRQSQGKEEAMLKAVGLPHPQFQKLGVPS